MDAVPVTPLTKCRGEDVVSDAGTETAHAVRVAADQGAVGRLQGAGKGTARPVLLRRAVEAVQWRGLSHGGRMRYDDMGWETPGCDTST